MDLICQKQKAEKDKQSHCAKNLLIREKKRSASLQQNSFDIEIEREDSESKIEICLKIEGEQGCRCIKVSSLSINADTECCTIEGEYLKVSKFRTFRISNPVTTEIDSANFPEGDCDINENWVMVKVDNSALIVPRIEAVERTKFIITLLSNSSRVFSEFSFKYCNKERDEVVELLKQIKKIKGQVNFRFSLEPTDEDAIVIQQIFSSKVKILIFSSFKISSKEDSNTSEILNKALINGLTINTDLLEFTIVINHESECISERMIELLNAFKNNYCIKHISIVNSNKADAEVEKNRTQYDISKSWIESVYEFCY